MKAALATVTCLALLSACGGRESVGESAPDSKPSVSPAKRFKDCAKAKAQDYVGFERGVTRASEGDLPGVEAAGRERAANVLANRRCFTPADIATAKELRNADFGVPELAKQAPKECRDTVADVGNLFNYASGLKAVSKEDSDKAAEGFARISERDPDCFNEDAVQIVLKNLAEHQS